MRFVVICGIIVFLILQFVRLFQHCKKKRRNVMQNGVCNLKVFVHMASLCPKRADDSSPWGSTLLFLPSRLRELLFRWVILASADSLYWQLFSAEREKPPAWNSISLSSASPTPHELLIMLVSPSPYEVACTKISKQSSNGKNSWLFLLSSGNVFNTVFHRFLIHVMIWDSLVCCVLRNLTQLCWKWWWVSCWSPAL